MRDAVQKRLDEIGSSFDKRISVFDLHIEQAQAEGLVLSGQVLHARQLELVKERLAETFPGLPVATGAVKVLDTGRLPVRHIWTNLTGLYDKPSFDGPLASELCYGTRLEVLAEQEKWAFMRQEDGYLGWAYREYLQEGEAAQPTHLVLAPSIELRSQPDAHGSVLTRLVSGSGVMVEEHEGDWVRLQANQAGWVPAGCLRAVKDLPRAIEQRRLCILGDSARMVGTPYLWGGTSGNGIDCSGLSRLLHRWIGIQIPRDADMQHAAARPVEPPYEVGDLFFFSDREKHDHITHVGMCLGGWKVAHASRVRNGVYVDDMQELDRLRRDYVSAGSFLR